MHPLFSLFSLLFQLFFPFLSLFFLSFSFLLYRERRDRSMQTKSSAFLQTLITRIYIAPLLKQIIKMHTHIHTYARHCTYTNILALRCTYRNRPTTGRYQTGFYL